MTTPPREPLPDSRIWFVRAERQNALADCFLKEGLVAMGWDIGPILPTETTPEIKDRLRNHYGLGYTPATVTKWATQIREFNQDMLVGDPVATYEPSLRTYHLGIIRELLVPYSPFAPLLPYGCEYVHNVDWLYQVARDSLPRDFARFNLDRRSTVHRLSDEASAQLRLLALKSRNA